MVLSERNTELVRNGRRSRGPSPNGHNSTTIMGVTTNSNSNNNNSSGANSTSGMGNSGVGGGNTPDTSSDDDNSMKQKNGIRNKNTKSEYEEKIRVGRDFQATCPPFALETERSKLEGTADRALLVWKPTKEIPDTKLEEYISVAKEKYGYNGEQALGMLFWHKHDLERAVMDLANFTPFPDEWTIEDKVLFEQAFQFHGKSFHRIRQMLPDKSIASLVKYYYSWKKTRHRQSTMDRQEKSKGSKEGSENGSENGSNEDSDNDDKDQTAGIQDSSKSSKSHNNYNFDNVAAAAAPSTTSSATGGSGVGVSGGGFENESNDNAAANSEKSIGICIGACSGRSNCQGCDNGYCSNCGVNCHVLFQSPQGKLCDSCHHHWRRTGEPRPTSCPYKRMRGDRCLDNIKKRRPRGIHINHDDIVTLATKKYGSHDHLMVALEREIEKSHTRIQQNKAGLSDSKKKITDSVDESRPPDGMNRINARWSNDECLLAVQGVRRYGKDFQTIAELIGTKTEAHVRTFYVNHRRRYNLDQLLKNHETDKQAATANTTGAANNDNDKDVDEKPNNGSTVDLDVDMVDIAADDDDDDDEETKTTPGTTITTTTSETSTTVATTTAAGTSVSDGEITAKKEKISIDVNKKLDDALATEKKPIGNSVEQKDSSNDIEGFTTTTLSTASTKNTENNNNNNSSKQIVAIDLDAEPLDDASPAKKMAIAISNQLTPEAKAAGS